MKKILVIFLALAVTMSIAACSKKGQSSGEGEIVTIDDASDISLIEDRGSTTKAVSDSDSKTTTAKKGEETKTTTQKQSTTKKQSASKKKSTTKKGSSSQAQTVTGTEKFETPIIPLD